MKATNKSFVFFISYLVIIFSSCNGKTAGVQNLQATGLTSNSYQPSKLIDSLTKLFLDSAKCEACLNELYIDKVYKDEVYFTFITRHFEKNYFTVNKPSFFYSINKKKVFVYSGAESFLVGDQKNTEMFDTFIINTNIRYLQLQFHFIVDSIGIVQLPSGPFMPKINPAPDPDDNVPKFELK